MKAMQKIKIEMEEHFAIGMKKSGKGRVWIDDREVQEIVSIKFEAGVERTNNLTLELLAPNIELTAKESEVEIKP